MILSTEGWEDLGEDSCWATALAPFDQQRCCLGKIIIIKMERSKEIKATRRIKGYKWFVASNSWGFRSYAGMLILFGCFVRKTHDPTQLCGLKPGLVASYCRLISRSYTNNDWMIGFV